MSHAHRDGDRNGHQRRPGSSRRTFGVDRGKLPRTTESSGDRHDEPHKRAGEREADKQRANGIHRTGDNGGASRNVDGDEPRADEQSRTGDRCQYSQRSALRSGIGDLPRDHRLDRRHREHRSRSKRGRGNTRQHTRGDRDDRRIGRQVIVDDDRDRIALGRRHPRDGPPTGENPDRHTD